MTIYLKYVSSQYGFLSDDFSTISKLMQKVHTHYKLSHIFVSAD